MNVKIYRYVLKVKFEKMKPQAVVQRNFTFFLILLLMSYRTFNMHYQDAVRALLSSIAGVIIRLVKLNMEFLWLSLIRKPLTTFLSRPWVTLLNTDSVHFDYLFKNLPPTPHLLSAFVYISFFIFFISSFMCVFQRICSSILYICAF